jgi:hypothetical protein
VRYKANLECCDLAQPSPVLTWQHDCVSIVGTVFPRRQVGA